MSAMLDITIYLILLWLLTFGGNAMCKLVLHLSATKSPPEQGEQVSLRAGRTIGVLERLLICLGLILGSWEILAAVIALKTVARYAKLNEQQNAEYFLIGSLASILWAAIITVLIALYDKNIGFNVISDLMTLIGPPTS